MDWLTDWLIDGWVDGWSEIVTYAYLKHWARIHDAMRYGAWNLRFTTSVALSSSSHQRIYSLEYRRVDGFRKVIVGDMLIHKTNIVMNVNNWW